MKTIKITIDEEMTDEYFDEVFEALATIIHGMFDQVFLVGDKNETEDG